MCEDIKLILPATPDYTTTLRLFASGVASRAGLDVYTLEDVKLCLSELMIMAIKDEFKEFKTEIKICENYLSIYAVVSEDEKDSMSIKIMEALSDELEVEEDSIVIKFKKEN